MQKIKKVLANEKNTRFSLSNFRFFSLEKTRRRRSRCATGAHKWRRSWTFWKICIKHWFVLGEKVLAKNKNSTCKNKKHIYKWKKVFVFSVELSFFLFRNVPQALHLHRGAQKWRSSWNCWMICINNWFSGEKYLPKIKIVLTKNKKKYLQMQKKLVFLSRTFVFYLSKKRGAGAPGVPQALTNGTAVENFEKYA